jgi:type I restriction enzyme S subunit
MSSNQTRAPFDMGCGVSHYEGRDVSPDRKMPSSERRWPVFSLGEIAEIKLGKMLDKSKHQTGRRFPYLRNINVRWGAVDTTDILEMHFEDGQIERFSLRPGDVLVCEGGEPGRAAVWQGQVAEMKFQKAIHRVRFTIPFEPSLLVYLLESLAKSGALERRFTGSTIKHFTREAFVQLPVPVPPIGEQRRLVAEIEKQFTQLDAGVAALRRVQANLKRYRTAVLKAACEGKLVPTEAKLAGEEQRKFESASELISRTQPPVRPNRWNSRSKDIIFGHTALGIGNPKTELPNGWTWSALVEIARMESGHTPSRNHPEWWDGDVAWIGIADAREHNGRTIHDTFQHTNLEGISNSASRLLPAGTVCISRTASVGYVVVMGREMATSQDFVNWTPTQAVTSDWLRIIFSADREALRRFGKGSIHKTIYFPEWLSVHIAVPPLAEQKRIASELERRFSVVDELESMVSANLQRATRLRRSILQKAFFENFNP